MFFIDTKLKLCFNRMQISPHFFDQNVGVGCVGTSGCEGCEGSSGGSKGSGSSGGVDGVSGAPIGGTSGVGVEGISDGLFCDFIVQVLKK